MYNSRSQKNGHAQFHSQKQTHAKFRPRQQALVFLDFSSVRLSAFCQAVRNFLLIALIAFGRCFLSQLLKSLAGSNAPLVHSVSYVAGVACVDRISRPAGWSNVSFLGFGWIWRVVSHLEGFCGAFGVGELLVI
jgi:hypothetical protein